MDKEQLESSVTCYWTLADIDVKQRILVLGCCMVLLLAVIWVLWNEYGEDISVQPELPVQGPDTLMRGVSMKTFDQDGRLQYEVYAETMSWEKNTGKYQITRPVIQHITADNQVWVLGAESATMQNKSSNGESNEDTVIHLTGDVKFAGPRETFTTESISYYPVAQIVKTEDSWKAENEYGWSEAKGLEIDLATGLYQITSPEIQTSIN